MIDPTGLMMIEPKSKQKEAPIDLTALARRARHEAKPGPRFRGIHICACGECSDNIEWTVRGVVTNSLLVHYVRDHRSEVPRTELQKLLAFEEK